MGEIEHIPLHERLLDLLVRPVDEQTVVLKKRLPLALQKDELVTRLRLRFNVQGFHHVSGIQIPRTLYYRQT